MSITPLQQFIERVPVCSQTDSLETVRTIFSQGNCDCVAILNAQRYPCGLVHLRRFMLPIFVPGGQEPNWQQPISELEFPLVEPLTALPANLSLRHFWTYLQEPWQKSKIGIGECRVEPLDVSCGASSQPPHQARPGPVHSSLPATSLTPIALVDPNGQFLGLLDSMKLLQFLAVNEFSSDRTPHGPEGDRTPVKSYQLPAASALERERSGTHPFEFQSPLQSSNPAPQTEVSAPTQTPATAPKFLADVNSWGRAESGTPPSIKSLDQLVQLLEQLPVPLRLQTSVGHIITQNLAWRSLVGTGPDPGTEAVKAASRAWWQPPEDSEASHFPQPGKTDPRSYQSPDSLDSTRAAYPLQQPQMASGLPHPPSSSRSHPNQESVSPAKSPRSTLDTSSAPEAVEPTSQSYRAPNNFTHKNHQPDSSPEMEAAMNGCRSAGKPDTYICATPGQKNSERVWLLIKQKLNETPGASQNTEDSALDLWLVFAQDITEQELVAKELATKNADLIQLNRLKDEFLACISHELKTPLTAILGLSSLLQDRVLGELSDRQSRYAKLIHQSGRHLMAVVNDILDLTRIETGQLELIPEPVQIQATCDRAFETVERLQAQEDKPLSPRPAEPEGSEPQPKTTFTLDIEPGLTNIEADELRLRQMLVNLLSNALKFTEAGGEIGLKVSQWEAWIAFTVWDTGIGIPPDKQHLIFQKFQQLESPLTRRFQGTGLGLVLTQRLARLHGGDVSFISKEGKGSQFTLLLPPCPPSAGEKNSPESRQEFSLPRLRSRLILIVEAVPRFIEDLTNLLIGLGYQVVIARSGTEALEKARRFSPEAIFLNPLLPLLSGWDVLTLLKTDPDTHHIPVIITATRGDKDRATLNRADGFVSLPVQESALREQLDEVAAASKATHSSPRPSLTILWLSSASSPTGEPQEQSPSDRIDKLPTTGPELQAVLENPLSPTSFIVSPCHCRVLEAEDLDQAELLARIWQPDVMILAGTSNLSSPGSFIQELSQRQSLAALPLVTLDPATTQAANQVSGLSVFPYLGAPDIVKEAGDDAAEPMARALLEVIQVAAGLSWKPTILAVDVLTLPDLSHPSQGNMLPFPLSPMIQYLQRAGFRSLIGRSWAEVLQQLQYQSVDLLLICLRDQKVGKTCFQDLGVSCPPAIAAAFPQTTGGITTPEGRVSPIMLHCEMQNIPQPAAVQAVSSLAAISAKPPILVLDQRLCPEGDNLTALFDKITAQILPSSVPMTELLEVIKQILK